MHKIKTEKQSEKKFEGYENARESKDDKDPEASSEKSVEAATNRLHPDENLMDRGWKISTHFLRLCDISYLSKVGYRSIYKSS